MSRGNHNREQFRSSDFREPDTHKKRSRIPRTDTPPQISSEGDQPCRRGEWCASSVIVAVSRGFPQAASTDIVWRTEPFGDAGAATLEIEIAEDGSAAVFEVFAGSDWNAMDATSLGRVIIRR